MTSRLISSLARCSIPRVSFISRSQFYSTTPLISMTLMLRNLISKPCCAVSFRSASSKSSASENDKVKYDDKDLLLVLESVIAQKNMGKVLPKDFPFEIIDNPQGESITLKREYDGEQIEANVFKYFESKLSVYITIDKQDGRTLNLRCNLTPDGFETCNMSLESSENSQGKYFEGPVLFDSDERLESAFQEYLAARGFKKSIYDYLDYLMDQKGSSWQRLKGFIEK